MSLQVVEPVGPGGASDLVLGKPGSAERHDFIVRYEVNTGGWLPRAGGRSTVCDRLIRRHVHGRW